MKMVEEHTSHTPRVRRVACDKYVSKAPIFIESVWIVTCPDVL